jgi:hypothetical protein
MVETWKNSYEELKKFIAAHPAIEIDAHSVVISGDIRPEFYSLFDRVRAGFVKERFSVELDKGYALSAAYAEASKAAKEQMHLEDIEINASLNWFLLDPVNGLMRVLFDPLFDLLKGKTNLAGFIVAGDAAIKDSFSMLYREGYERWGALALLKLLAPGRLWMGKTHDFYTDPTMEGDIIEGNRDEFVSDIVESRKVVFDNLVRASFVVPGTLIYSGLTRSYISLRPRWYLPRWKARMISEKMEWIDLKQIYKDLGTGNLWPDMMIHMTDQDPDDLKLIADYYRLARPDIIIEFMEDDEWYDAKRVEDIMRHNMWINPRLGTYVISRVEVPPEAFRPLEARPLAEPAGTDQLGAGRIHQKAASAPQPSDLTAMARPLSLAELPEGIHIINVGYNVTKLEPLIEALVKAAEMAKVPRPGELEHPRGSV